MTDPESEGTEERRKGERASALWEARLRDGADNYRCRVYDFSLTGAKVWIDETLEPGTVVKLDIDQIGVIRGRVAWAKQGQMGIEFTSDADEVRYLLGPRGRRFAMK
ncbi:MAG: PilZ domain-containing protein [Proteobacteria bacterium]|nr:PilZ domain-containing protein [Pseudomonadota bacterium]